MKSFKGIINVLWITVEGALLASFSTNKDNKRFEIWAKREKREATHIRPASSATNITINLSRAHQVRSHVNNPAAVNVDGSKETEGRRGKDKALTTTRCHEANVDADERAKPGGGDEVRSIGAPLPAQHVPVGTPAV